MVETGPIQISVDSVLRQRVPRHYRHIPRCLIRYIEHIICQPQLNDMLRQCYPMRGSHFCRRMMEYLHVTLQVRDQENLPQSPRAIFVCNHPMGGLDGLMILDMLSRHYGTEARFVVNDLLMAIEPLSESFLPINKHGAQSRSNARAMQQAMTSDAPIVIFPAGLVSRRAKGWHGPIRDLRWQTMFVNKAHTYSRPIVPMHISGRNTNVFYNFAYLRRKLGVKLNIEMLRLPAELVKARHRTYTLSIGTPVAPDELTPLGSLKQQVQYIRQQADRCNPSYRQ